VTFKELNVMRMLRKEIFLEEKKCVREGKYRRIFQKSFLSIFLNSIVNSIPNILKSCIKKRKK